MSPATPARPAGPGPAGPGPVPAPSTGPVPRPQENPTVNPLVAVENLTVTFPPRTPGAEPVHAVRGLDLTVAPGEAVGIVGESGSGKSLTVRTLVGLTGERARVRADRLEVAGLDALHLSDRQWQTVRGRRIGLVLQDALTSLDPLRTVGREISEALRLAGTARPAGTSRGPVARRRAERERAIGLLAEVGVPDPELRVDQYPHELSGGLRQRALIASAIAGGPDLIIADEPTTALDVTVQAQVLDVLAARRAAGSALLLISHDLAVVGQVCDRVLVMKDGEVVESGPSADILSHPRHLYTRRLLAAVPSAASRGRFLSDDAPHEPLPERQGRPAPDAAPVLTGKALTKDFPGPGGTVRRAVDHVDVALAPGETLGIVGESGSGKSTLARLLIALTEPDEGTVTLDSEPWAPLRERRRRPRRREIQIVSQDPISSFDPRYTVHDVIAEPLRSGASGSRGTRLTSAEITAQVRRVAELVDLPAARLHAHPLELSGGQRQRVAIARALVTRPRVLVADEPVSALDVSVQAQVLDLLARVRAETGTALVLISHDLGVVHHLADRVLVMKDGRVVESGDVDAVFTQPTHPYTRDLLAALPALPVAVAA